MGGTALSPLKPFGINEAIQETFMSDPIAFEELNRKFFEDHERREELGCKLLGIDGPGDFTRKANPEDCIDSSSFCFPVSSRINSLIFSMKQLSAKPKGYSMLGGVILLMSKISIAV